MDYQKNDRTAQCHCYLRNAHDKMADDKTALEKSCGKKVDGPSIPFGSLVEYNPIAAKDKSRVRQCGNKTWKGIFLGYLLRAGGGWSGYFMAADHEDLQGSETSDIQAKRFKSQGVFVQADYGFLCANGTLTRPRPSFNSRGTLCARR